MTPISITDQRNRRHPALHRGARLQHDIGTQSRRPAALLAASNAGAAVPRARYGDGSRDGVAASLEWMRRRLSTRRYRSGDRRRGAPPSRRDRRDDSLQLPDCPIARRPRPQIQTTHPGASSALDRSAMRLRCASPASSACIKSRSRTYPLPPSALHATGSSQATWRVRPASTSSAHEVCARQRRGRASTSTNRCSWALQPQELRRVTDDPFRAFEARFLSRDSLSIPLDARASADCSQPRPAGIQHTPRAWLRSSSLNTSRITTAPAAT